MVKSLRQISLTTAIGLALVGAGLQTSTVAEAATPQLATSAGISQASSDGIYIITFEEAGLLHYRGSVNGILSTAPRANGKLDVHSAAAQAYQSYLLSQRDNHVLDIAAALGRKLQVTHNYAITQNGIAAHLSPSEVATVAAMPGVKNVRAAGVEHLDTPTAARSLSGPIRSGAVRIRPPQSVRVVKASRWVFSIRVPTARIPRSPTIQAAASAHPCPS